VKALLLLIPIELVSLLLVAGGLAMIVGARQLAGSLLCLTAALVFLPALLAPLFDAMPDALLWPLLALFALVLLLALLRGASAMLIGRNATDTMVGELAARAVVGLLLFGARVISSIVRLPFRVLRRLRGS
jgi:hypothetical protein